MDPVNGCKQLYSFAERLTHELQAINMGTIDDFFEKVNEVLNSPKLKDCPYPVFRGHSNGNYELLPTLHRYYLKTGKDLWTLENNLYCDFRSLVGPRVMFKSSWEALFAMRHEGIPTRLLDWTENIGTALFFALSSKFVDNPHIWVLNPYRLNEREPKANGTLLNPDEDLGQYSETYASFCNNKTGDINMYPIAIYPNRTNERIFAQRGLFTIHGTDEQKMELTSNESIERIDIPPNLIESIKLLIKHFGINTYSVYPDFKGLSDYLKEIYKY